MSHAYCNDLENNFDDYIANSSWMIFWKKTGIKNILFAFSPFLKKLVSVTWKMPPKLFIPVIVWCRHRLIGFSDKIYVIIYRYSVSHCYLISQIYWNAVFVWCSYYFVLSYVHVINLTLSAWFFRFASCIVPKTTKKLGNLHGYCEPSTLAHLFVIRERRKRGF